MGADTASAAEGFRHEALLYRGWIEFIAGTVPFIIDGLSAGEPVLVVESADKIEALRTALGKDASKVQFADMAEFGANPSRLNSAWQEFVSRHDNGGGRLHGIGEPIWKGRSPAELIECQRQESLYNTTFGRGRPWTLLCPYDTTDLDTVVIDEARRSHEWVIEGRKAHRSSSYRGLAR